MYSFTYAFIVLRVYLYAPQHWPLQVQCTAVAILNERSCWKSLNKIPPSEWKSSSVKNIFIPLQQQWLVGVLCAALFVVLTTPFWKFNTLTRTNYVHILKFSHYNSFDAWKECFACLIGPEKRTCQTQEVHESNNQIWWKQKLFPRRCSNYM